MTITIRAGVEADLDALRAIFDYCYAYHRDALPSVFRRSEDYRGSDAFLRSCLSNPEAAVLVAECQHQVVGMAYVIDRCAPDISVLAPRRYAVLDTLAVLPESQRLGIGSALLGGAEAWALERGIAEIELSVWEFNQQAFALYENAGYQSVRRTMVRRLESQASGLPEDGARC